METLEKDIQMKWTASEKAVVDQDGYRILEADPVSRLDDLSSKDLTQWWDKGGYFIRSEKETHDAVRIAAKAPEMIQFLKEVQQGLKDCPKDELRLFDQFMLTRIDELLNDLP